MKDEGLKSKEEYFEKVWRDLKANKENYKRWSFHKIQFPNSIRISFLVNLDDIQYIKNHQVVELYTQNNVVD